jgi:2-aminoadipate transaminase
MGTVVAHTADLVSFAPGYPDPALFPWDDLRDISDALLRERNPSSLQYGPTRGHRPLLESIVGILDARGIHVDREQILITSGSQQGMDLAARVLIDPGDVVLVELPTFTGAIAAFRNAHARLAGVPVSANGIDPDGLDAVWQRETSSGRRVKLLYLIPNFQNPTGALLTLERRARILGWAERRDVLIIEDDPYGSLFFEDVARAAETRPLRADDRQGRVLYLSTFSKTLAPGFRVGWMVAPLALIDRFETAKQSTDLMSGSFDQVMVDAAVRRGVIDRIAPHLRETYRQKRDVMEKSLRTELAGRVTWRPPKGGFFVWLTLPEGITDIELLDRALQHGLVFVIGSAFHVDGSGHHTIRLSFSAPSLARIEEGVRRLATVMTPVSRGA